MQLIGPLISGIANAGDGSASVYRRGTSTPATLYSSFEGDAFGSASLDSNDRVILDAYGRAVVYVNEVCDVRVYDSDGALQIEFTCGMAASAVEVRSSSFTGNSYETGASAAQQPTNLQAVLDLWLATQGAIDWGIQAAAAPYFVVTDQAYGALGDGFTDDTAAIEAAIAAAAHDGGIVFFPGGSYRITSPIVVAGNVSLLGAPNASIGIHNTTDGVFEFDAPTRTFMAGLQIYASSGINSATMVTVTGGVRFVIAHCKIGLGAEEGTYLQLDGADVSIHDSVLGSSGGGAAASLVSAITQTGTGRTYVSNTTFYLPETFNPANALVYGNDLYFEGCLFDGVNVSAGTYSVIKFSAAGLRGAVIGCKFDNMSSTATAMTLGAYGSGSRFYEANNAFDSNMVMYSYTASSATTGVQLTTRDKVAKVVTDNTGTIAVPTDQFGVVIVKSTHASPVMTGTLPPYGARGVVLFYHPSGGVGTAQPTTNFFGGTAKATADTGTLVWEYVCAPANSALRMFIAVDGFNCGAPTP